MKILLLALALAFQGLTPSIHPYGEPARFEFAAGGRLGVLQPEYRSDVETDFISVFDLNSSRLAARFPGSDFTLSPDGYTLYVKACPEVCSQSDYTVNLSTLEPIGSLHTPLSILPQPTLQTNYPYLLSLYLPSNSPTPLTLATPKHPSLNIYSLSIISRKSPTTLIAGGEWGGWIDEVRGRAVWVRRKGVEVLTGGIAAKGSELVWSDGWIVLYSSSGRELRRRRISEEKLGAGNYWYDPYSLRLVTLKEDSIEVWHENGEHLQSRLVSAYHPGEIWFEGSRMLVYDYYDEETYEKTIWNLQTGQPEEYRGAGKWLPNRSTKPYRVTATAEGVKFWAVQDGTLLVTAVRTESGWMVYTPDGRYDASPENLDLFSLCEGGGASRAPTSGYTPGLLASVLRNFEQKSMLDTGL